MNKNLTRDLQILLKLLTYIKKMQTALQQYGCKTSSQFIANETCMDLCSFYILQISSLCRQLSKESYQAINFISTGNLIPVRNMIAHDYIQLNRQILYSFVQDCCRHSSYVQIQNQIILCKKNK